MILSRLVVYQGRARLTCCRPLLVQMFHNPEARVPICRLQDEDSESYGPPIQPETAVAEAIRGATEKHLRQIGKPVSAKPIIMHAE